MNDYFTSTEHPLYDVFVLVNGDGCVFQFVISYPQRAADHSPTLDDSHELFVGIIKERAFYLYHTTEYV